MGDKLVAGVVPDISHNLLMYVVYSRLDSSAFSKKDRIMFVERGAIFQNLHNFQKNPKFPKLPKIPKIPKSSPLCSGKILSVRSGNFRNFGFFWKFWMFWKFWNFWNGWKLEIRKVRGENFGNFGIDSGRAGGHPFDDRSCTKGLVKGHGLSSDTFGGLKLDTPETARTRRWERCLEGDGLSCGGRPTISSQSWLNGVASSR